MKNSWAVQSDWTQNDDEKQKHAFYSSYLHFILIIQK